MEIDSNNVAENEKYAFLLGSALKNEDTEQFFSIYDSILPKDLPDSQVERIKDQARRIADLPEEEFNNLVFKARNFSLAPAGTTMSCSESPSKKWVHPNDEDSEEDEGVSSTRYGSLPCGKSDTSSLYSINTTKISTRSFESDTHRFDDDSGVCNSSKATNSIGSWSDQEASDYEGHRHFDYYPQVKIRSGAGLSLDYDEAHEVKSDQSSQDVNSPRSDISEGREMVTYRTSYNPCLDDDDDEFQFTSHRRPVEDQDDFNTDGDSDDDKNVRAYRDRGYMPVYKESEYSNYSYEPKFESRKWCDSMGLSTSSLRNTDVDKSINFSGLKDGTSQYSRHLSYTAGSEKVKIEKNSYKKDQPPFGRGEEQLHKVGNSVGKLISNFPAGDVENMPEGRKLEVLTSQDISKKNKKKRTKRNPSLKDDAATDENGNPIEGLGLKKIDYRQMRESPSGVGGTAGSNRQHTNYGTLETLTNLSHTNKDTEDGANKTQERRKGKKKLKEKTKLSEDVDNYIGNKTVEELVLLIDGQNASSKKSKKLSPNVTNDIPGKTPKTNKKSKDKKQKSPTPSNSIEEVEAKGDSSVQKTVSETQVSSDNMGNLSAKTDVNIPVENGDIDGIYCKKDKLTKPLLKEDRKDTKSSIVIDCNISEIKSTFCKESVKEKGGAKTNIKRETVSETISDKKKSEKQKTPKVEKSEMSASKSEETMRVESSLTVKQKNAKNKKSKPMSPTVTLDNNVSHFDVISQSPPVITSISDDNLIGDSNFIFTDLDVPQVPKEDEFQVVGKKKKKPVKESVPQNNFIGNNKPHRRFDDKRTTPTNHTNRSPAPSTIQSSPIENDPHARDLSPSSFPALVSGKGRQSLQDGRRNSTGDVPIPSESLLKPQDDSDMESVKSLPATQGGLDSMLSPRLNVSYAKMAASSNKGSNSGERSSLESDDQSEHELKKAMWKGSPTERRHSIGSSPEGVVIKSNKNSSVAISSVASKGGSQENIKGEISVPSRLESSVKSECPLGGISATEVVKSKDSVTEPSCSVEVEFGDCNIEVVKVSTMPVQTVQHSSSVVPQNTCPADSPTVFSSNTRQPVADTPTKSSSVDLQTSKVTSYSSNNGSHSKSIPPSSNVQKETPKGKVISLNNKKQKSVIFLDKPFEENPGSLGISFGFEIEPLVSKTNRTGTKAVDMSTVEVEKPLLEKAEDTSFDKSKDSVTNLVPEIDDTKSDDDKVSNKSSSSSVIDTNDSKQDSLSSKSESTDPLGKVASQLSRLNGVVSTPQGQNVNLVNENISDVNETDSSASVQVPQAEQSVKRVPQANEVIVYYGEGVATLKKDVVGPSLTNGPTRYCGLITYVQESELRSNFSIAEAASFLTKEWDRVRQLQDREPDSVKVHQN